MEVFALYGPSGTGKSTSALSFAYEKNIPAIVDDGLLVYRGKRAGGTSAKFEKNHIKAIKRAIFYDEDHAEEVRKAIRLFAIDKILLIGTSVKMVNRIAKKLELEPINHYVGIEEVRSSGEIKMALFIRKTKGSHILPIPPLQVEPGLFKKLIAEGMKIFSPKKELIGETTIVRPEFHSNTLHISEQVFKSIAVMACEHFCEIVSCDKVKINFDPLPSLSLEVTLRYPLDGNFREMTERIQKKISDDFTQHFDLELGSIQLRVAKLVKK